MDDLAHIQCEEIYNDDLLAEIEEIDWAKVWADVDDENDAKSDNTGNTEIVDVSKNDNTILIASNRALQYSRELGSQLTTCSTNH